MKQSFILWLVAGGLWAAVNVACASEGLTLGVFPRYNQVESLAMYTPLADYLSEALGQPVQLHVSKDFPSFWQTLASGRYDIVHLNQYHYIKAHHLYGYRPLVRNEEQGSDQIRTVLLTTPSSRITRVEQLRGKRIMFGGDRSAMMSYIVPRKLLQEHGLGPDDYLPLFAINPINALLSLQTENADATGIGESNLTLDVAQQHRSGQAPRVLVTSSSLAQLPWAVAERVDAGLGQRLQRLLLNLKQSESGRGVLRGMGLTGLVTAVDADYDPHRKIVLEILGERY